MSDTQRQKEKKNDIRFIGVPSPKDIAKAVYGRNIDDKLRKSTVERILPCIIDEQRIPRDLVDLIVHRASNRVGMEDWEWKKTLSIACALYKKYKTDYILV
jgi:CRISPR-associated protein Csd1